MEVKLRFWLDVFVLEVVVFGALCAVLRVFGGGRFGGGGRGVLRYGFRGFPRMTLEVFFVGGGEDGTFRLAQLRKNSKRRFSNSY